MSKVFEQAEELGVRMAIGQTVLPELAILTCQAAAAGKVTVDEALDLYAAYWGAGGRRHVDRALPSFRVQASKLRVFIKLGDQHGRQGVKLLREAMALHARLYLKTSVTYYDCYNALVAVARKQCNNERILCESSVRKAMRMKR